MATAEATRVAPWPLRIRRAAGRASDRLGFHPDRSARALGHAHAAALAVVEVDRVAVHVGGSGLAQLQHGVVGADAVAVVAGEAVAAREAAAGLEQGVRLVEALHHLVEGPLAA